MMQNKSNTKACYLGRVEMMSTISNALKTQIDVPKQGLHPSIY